MTLNTPPNGTRISFITVPAGSYATAGEVYDVTLYGKPGRRQTVDLRNVATGASTQDAAIMYDRAVYVLAS